MASRFFFLVFALLGALVSTGCLGNAGLVNPPAEEPETPEIMDSLAEVFHRTIVSNGTGKNGANQYLDFRAEYEHRLYGQASASLYGESLYVYSVSRYIDNSIPGLTRVYLYIQGGITTGDGAEPVFIPISHYAQSSSYEDPVWWSYGYSATYAGNPAHQIGRVWFEIDGKIITSEIHSFRVDEYVAPMTYGRPVGTWELTLKFNVETRVPSSEGKGKRAVL